MNTYAHTHIHTHTQVALGTENIRAPFGIPFAQDPEDEVEDKSYEKQLQKLAEEGYDNLDINLRLLEMHEGDVDEVIRTLAGADQGKKEEGVWS
jgi:hypothetical protein